MESFNQETLRRIAKNDPSLRVLRISDIATPNPNHGDVGMYVPSTNAEFTRLGNSIGHNTNLESLCFDGDLGLGVAIAIDGAFSKGIKRNRSISRLSLFRCDLSEDGAGRQILAAFRHCNLSRISLQRCIGGTQVLTSTLSTCKDLRYIRVTECRGNLRPHGGLLLNHVLDESVKGLVSVLHGHKKLEELDLGHNDIIGTSSCEALAALLRDPKCNLATLGLENNLIGNDSAVALASSLKTNCKLKNMYLHGNPIFVGASGSGLQHAFSRILCNTSTINSTYYSNHTLQSFVRWDWVGGPQSLCAHLELSRSSSDQKQIAMQKIIRHHRHIDMEPFFEWDLKVLPVAISWFEAARKKCAEDNDNADINIHIDGRKWSAIYQFALDMPMMFVPYR